MIKIEEATLEQMPIVRALFEEYAAQLSVSLCFQGFQEELDSLPYLYVKPAGTILLAKLDDTIVGVVALKPLPDGSCEMKRLYVKPEGRGHQLGKLLSERLLMEAKNMGYATMKLDTLARLKPAVKLYEDLGFQKTQPYNHNPNDDILYFEKTL